MLAASGTVNSLDSGIGYHFMNVDGLVLVAGDDDRTAGKAYVQVFRSGAVETADTKIMLPAQDGSHVIRRKTLEQNLSEFVYSIGNFYKSVGIEPPIVVTVTMLGVKGFTGVSSGRDSTPPIPKSTIRFPPVEISQFADNFSDAGNGLRPIFDVLAQSVGLRGSESFDSDGKWHNPVGR